MSEKRKEHDAILVLYSVFYFLIHCPQKGKLEFSQSAQKKRLELFAFLLTVKQNNS